MSEVKRRDMLALAAYQEELARRPALRYLFFELTDRCNLRCRHCGSGCVPEKGTALPFEAVAKALEDTAAVRGDPPRAAPGIPDRTYDKRNPDR